MTTTPREREEQFDRHYREEVLATTRFALSLAALVAIYIDPTEPAGFATLAYGLLVCYVVFSVGLVILLRARREITPRFVVGVHATDIVWAATISLFTSGPSSAFFVFFVFVILTAAFRWRMRDTMWTTAILVVVLLVEGAFLEGASAVFGGFEVNRLIIRSVYLLIVGFFAGYLSEKAKKAGEEAIFISELLRGLRSELRFRQALEFVLTQIVQALGSTRGLVVLHDLTTGHVSLAKTGSFAAAVSWRELTAQEGAAFFFPLSGTVARVPGPRSRVKPLALDDVGHRLPHPVVPQLPGTFLDADAAVFLAADLFTAEEWRARAILVHGSSERITADAARLLYRIVQSVGPVVYNVFLISRLHSQASAAERSRVALEIHDNSLQGLAAIELQMKALEQQAKATGDLGEEIGRIRGLVHEETLTLRDLMHRTRPLQVNPANLPDAIADVAERFERETGIFVRLETDIDSIDATPATCRHVVRILQEALINIRKHAGARAVNVALEAGDSDGGMTLKIADDGKGFPFDGELSLDELEERHFGPRVIGERVHLIGAHMTLRSSPGRGSEIRVIVPGAQKGVYA